jgi:hypothetical protein
LRADEVKQLATSFTDLSIQVAEARSSVDRLAASMGPATEAVHGFASAMSTVFDIQKMIQDGYRTGQQQGNTSGRQNNDSARDNKIADQLSNLENELKGAFGNDNFAAAVIDNQVQALRAGTLDPQQAFEVIRGVLGPYFTGGQLFAELADPNPEIRKLAEEMERFLAGGQLNP